MIYCLISYDSSEVEVSLSEQFSYFVAKPYHCKTWQKHLQKYIITLQLARLSETFPLSPETFPKRNNQKPQESTEVTFPKFTSSKVLLFNFINLLLFINLLFYEILYRVLLQMVYEKQGLIKAWSAWVVFLGGLLI